MVCLSVFECVLEYFGAENIVVRPFWGAFSRPILGKHMADTWQKIENIALSGLYINVITRRGQWHKTVG